MCHDLCSLYFKSTIRKHPDTGKLSGYYRLVESYRNGDNRICHRTILNVGFMEDATPEQLNRIQKVLTEKYERKEPLIKHQEHRGTVATVSTMFTDSGFEAVQSFEEKLEMKFANGTAFLNHYFVKLGWLASWKALIPAEILSDGDKINTTI